MTSSQQSTIEAALDTVVNPRTGSGLMASGMIADLDIGADGAVSFTVLLRRDDPATLVRQVRQALTAAGVPQPKIAVRDPEGPAPTTHAAPQSASANVPAAPVPSEIPGLGRVIAISSGKGGVGKSTVAINVAVALAERGLRVGIMDADIYGPNLPRMAGVYEKPAVRDGLIQPLEAWGVKLMSIGFLVDRDAPAIWRGPIIMKVINQFLRDVAWGELDCFIVDMPPGTGDAQLSLVQSVLVSGAVIVTTPQEMSVGDALRGAKMFERVNVPLFGIVENMSGFLDPVTGMRHDLFGTGGGERLAEELDAELLGQVPLQGGMADAADRGRPIIIEAPTTAAAVMLREIADRIWAKASSTRQRMPVLEG